MEERIKAFAHQLGFALAGITTPDPPPHFEVYQHWLAAGRHGTMAYLASERAQQRRADPRQILPQCQSILVLGMRYTNPKDMPSSTGHGRIAAYAWEEDYHDFLQPRLKALVDFIKAATGHAVPNRWYTDTGPILERELAQRAGLGWIGKNTCLIAPQQGSYFLLAEILLGIPLTPDSPFQADRCGNCTRCIQACPTQCILPDRTLDARRCISYLTIENKAEIPLDLRSSMGEWIFGCDICQMVCPWNHFAPDTPVETIFPILHDEFALTARDFNRKFKGTPIQRAKRRGYLRNVAVVMGNQCNPADIPALGKALQDDEPLVRAHAAWALGRMHHPDAVKLLQHALPFEDNLQVQNELNTAINSAARSD